ncbi:MAG: IPT/TIG domain-containing protein [Pedobacter sp.]|uniref:IPT/TIG domain-containing protein n=1 Tax=Pedobacter sp. TaxID=1411316 RepID=UPI0028092AE5|nr:IPT/TIG domain-containing protein [Pedobacter sp.]MDQ8006610.1 IPT/TIG domain-containing protein [Pedobacter sp.]
MFIKNKLLGLLLVIVSLLLLQCAKTYDYELTDNTPKIDSIRPERGTENTQVRIYGKNFPKDTASLRAFFNNKQGLIIEQTTANVILATVPYEAGTGPVSVKSGDQTFAGPTFTYDYDAPVILDVSPLIGIAGTEITINGRKFSGIAANNKIQINGVDAGISSSSTTQLKAIVPEAKNGPITVTSNNISNQGPVFKFIPQIASIDKTSAFVGETVRLTGKYFDVATAKSVTFNGVSASIVSGSASTLDVTVPASTSGNIVVNIDGVNSNPIAFNYRIAPAITGLSKTSAFAQDTLTVYGANFAGNAAPIVRFGSTEATVMNYVHNSIKVRVPNGSGVLPVTVTVDNVNSNSVSFTYLQNIVAASLNQTSPVLRNVSGIDAATVVVKGSNFGTDASRIRVTVGDQNAQVTAVDDANVTFLSPSYHSSLPNQQQIKIFHQNVEASYPNGNLTFTYLEPTILSTTCTVVPAVGLPAGWYTFTYNIAGNHFNATAPNSNFEILIDGVKYTTTVNGNNAVVTTTQTSHFIKNRYDIRVNNKWGSFISAFQRNVTISNFDFTFNNNQRIVTITGEGFGSTVDLNRSIRVYRMDGSTKVYLNVGAITSWTDNQLTTTFTDTYIDDRTYGVEVRVNSRNATREKFLNYQQVN